MKDLRFVAFIALSVAIFAGSGEAQKKTGKRSSSKSAASKTLPPLEVRAAREKVDNQLANVNRFVEGMGELAQNIEDLDAQAQTKPLSKRFADLNASHKEQLLLMLRNLRTGLTNLESDFRTKPVLQRYLPSIQGISQLSAEAEDSAIAGRFVAAKVPLRTVSQKLTDTLKVLPAAPPI